MECSLFHGGGVLSISATSDTGAVPSGEDKTALQMPGWRCLLLGAARNRASGDWPQRGLDMDPRWRDGMKACTPVFPLTLANTDIGWKNILAFIFTPDVSFFLAVDMKHTYDMKMRECTATKGRDGDNWCEHRVILMIAMWIFLTLVQNRDKLGEINTVTQ